MEKKKFKIGLYSLIAIVLIGLFGLLSFLAYEAVLLNKNLEKAQLNSKVAATPVEKTSVSGSVKEEEDVPSSPSKTSKPVEKTIEEEPVVEKEPVVKEEERVNTDVESIIKKQFSEYLDKSKDSSLSSEERITDYSIDKIDILEGEKKDYWVENGGYKTSDVLAYVTYSVKPVDINSSFWFAGKEPTVDGEWLRGKFYCVSLTDGKLAVLGTAF